MLFNSVGFLVFFSVVFLVYWNMPGSKARLTWLFTASAFFYGYWNIWFLGHFLLVMLVSYGFIRLLLRQRKRWILSLAVGLNIANLAFFKYTSSVLFYLHQMTGWERPLLWNQQLGIILPLAISFYTFQIIAFIVDVWRGEFKDTSLLEFAVFIFFFPHLMAGPIMRHRDLYHQLYNPVLNDDKIYTGLLRVLSGIFKKVVIADQIRPLINPVWADPSRYDSISLVLGILGFSVQIYGDFSGYTDMARGVASLMGFEIPENFADPFFSTSFRELWQKWHITLSTWIRDYLYIPLGGSRAGPVRASANMIIAMSLAGLWHGTTYTFLLWGFFQGVLLVVERMVMGRRTIESVPGKIVGFLTTTAGWLIVGVFFRAPDMTTAIKYYRGFFRFSGQGIENPGMLIALVSLAMLFQYFRVRPARIESFLFSRPRISIFALSTLLFFILTGMEVQSEQFIYFQF